jgi:GH24 family phage-related lysozyme (muramidase)
LIITEKEAEQIDIAVKKNHIDSLIKKYDSAPNNKIRFINLPAEAQTVVASVSFQYGVNLDLRTPKFWKAATAQDWKECVKLLNNFGDAYPTRRKAEAKLIERIAK